MYITLLLREFTSRNFHLIVFQLVAVYHYFAALYAEQYEAWGDICCNSAISSCYASRVYKPFPLIFSRLIAMGVSSD